MKIKNAAQPSVEVRVCRTTPTGSRSSSRKVVLTTGNVSLWLTPSQAKKLAIALNVEARYVEAGL